MTDTPKQARSMREALVQQALEELDGVVVKVEQLVDRSNAAELQMAKTIEALDASSDRFRMSVTAFVEEAKANLDAHLQRRAATHIERTIEELHGAMQDAARIAFRTHASDEAVGLAKMLKSASSEFSRARWTRIGENLAIAIVASSIVAGVLVALLK